MRSDPDLFDDAVVRTVLSAPHVVRRPWLEQELNRLLGEPDCRIVLVTGSPGAGKSVLLAGLADAHPASLRYFLRQDSIVAHRSNDVHSLLAAVGHQFAGRHPQLIDAAELGIKVTQSVEHVASGASVAGVRAEEIVASPFRATAVEVRQELGAVAGSVVGVEARRVVVDLRAMDWRDVQHLALFGPLDALLAADPQARVLLVIDALDEGAAATVGIAEWLASCPPLSSALRIVVSARDGDFLGPLRIRQAHQLRELHVDTESSDAIADVTRHLDLAVASLDLAALDRSRAAIVDEWAGAAAGNFQYAVALVAGVEGALRRGDVESAKALAGAEAVPPGLRPLYTLLVSRIRAFVGRQSVPLLDGGTGSTWNDVYVPVLGTLAVAREPAPAGTVAELAGVRVASRWLREAIADMTQFIDDRGDGCRFHHKSVADFLTDPATLREAPDCYVDPEEWHTAVGMNGARARSGYGLRNAAAHLVEAGRRRPLGSAASATLAALTTDLATIEERVTAAGVDAVVEDGLAAAPLLGDAAEAASAVGRALDRERHVLRQWDAARHPALLAQQVHNQAIESASEALAASAAARLDAQAGPALRLRFAAGSSGAALLRTISVGTAVHAICRADDGRLVAGCDDGSVRVYDASTGRLLEIRQVARGSVLAVAWSARHGAVWGSLDGHVGRWRPGSDEVTELEVVGVHGAPEGSTVDSEVLMTALNRQDPVWLMGGPGSVGALAVREDGGVAIGTRQGAVLVIDPTFGGFAAGVPLHDKAVTGLHFGPGAVIACSHDGTIRRTDLSSATVLLDAQTPYTGLTVAETGAVAASRWDGATDLIPPDGDVRTGRAAGLGPATAVASGPGDRLYVGFLNRRVWVLGGDLTFTTSLRGHGGTITALAGLSEHVLASGSSDGTIRLWALEEQARAPALAGHDGPVSALVFDAGGQLLSGSADGTIRMWDRSGASQQAPVPARGQVWGLALLPDGTCAAATQSGDILLLEPVGAALRGHPQEARAVVALEDGRLVSADQGGAVVLWTPQRGGWHRRQVASFPGGAYALAAVGPASVAVATGEPDVPVLEVDGGDVHTLTGHTLGVHAVAAGPDGTLLTGSHDGTARVWNLAAGRTTMVYDDHEADVCAFALLGGRLVLSGSGDRTLRLWDAGTGETAALCALDQPIDCLAVDPPGDRVAVGHANGAVAVLAVTQLTRSAARRP